MATIETKQTSLLKWAAQEKWDWLLALPIPQYPCPEMAEANFWPWLRAIQRYDATWSFRYMRLKQMGRFVPVNEVDETFVLVDGLGSGEWRYWSLQWAARNGNPGLRGRKLWCARDNKPLGPVLRNICEEGQFLISMRHGIENLRREQCLKVDDKGIPDNPKLRRALKRGLRANDRKALESNPPHGWRPTLKL